MARLKLGLSSRTAGSSHGAGAASGCTLPSARPHSGRAALDLPRATRNLNALLKISRIVHQIHDLEKLQSQILELMFEVAPAERGAILLDGQGEKFASVFARHRASASTHPVRVSRTIARKVVMEGIAILGTDVLRNDGLNSVESLLVSNVRSLLCVPLIVFQKVTGCIYLDTSNSSARFDEDHLAAGDRRLPASVLWHWRTPAVLRPWSRKISGSNRRSISNIIWSARVPA